MSLYPLSVDCPECGAARGHLCVTPRQTPAEAACESRWNGLARDNHRPDGRLVVLERLIGFATRSDFPTEDAYLAACRALRWRHGQLRSLGYEPDELLLDCPSEPPEGHVFKNEPTRAAQQARRPMPPLSGGSGKRPPQEHHVRLTVEDMGPIVANELEKAFNNLPVGAVLQKVHGYGWAIQAALKALADPGDAGRALAVLILEHAGVSDGLA